MASLNVSVVVVASSPSFGARRFAFRPSYPPGRPHQLSHLVYYVPDFLPNLTERAETMQRMATLSIIVWADSFHQEIERVARKSRW